jgi:hypothetical protein
VGFWQGIKTGSTARALRITVFYVFLLRWIWLLGFIAFLGALSQGRIFQSVAGGTIAAVGYVLLFLASTLHFCGAARSELQDDLRLLALSLTAERSKPPWSLRDLSRAVLSH